MENKFKIPYYNVVDNKYIKIGYAVYIVTYLKGLKPDTIRIVVNGYLTKQLINTNNHRTGYKNNILLAIKEYVDNYKPTNIKVNKKLNLNTFKQNYSKNSVINVLNYLLPINKEESRDKLTTIGLIKN